MDSNLMGLDALPTTDPTDDLSSIAWVHEELRRSLEAAHKSLRRFLKDSEAVTGSDIDSVDPGVSRAARSQIHQGVGALELVGLPAAAIVLRASETAIQRAIAKPQSLTPELVSDLEHASFGLLDYLARLLAGKQVSSLSLFPAYRAVQESVEAERVHPADLWAVDWRWREVASDPDVVPRQADTTVRAEFEGHLLSLMRGTQTLTAAAKMSEICAGLGVLQEAAQRLVGRLERAAQLLVDPGDRAQVVGRSAGRQVIQTHEIAVHRASRRKSGKVDAAVVRCGNRALRRS